MTFTAIIVGMLGFLVGGVLNILADDLPHYQRPRLPHYPDDTPRPPIAWFGTFAFLTGHRAPATNPDARLSWRYPLTEIATAIAFALTILRVDAINADDVVVNATQTAFWLFYAAIFVLIVVIDVEHHLILFAVIIPSTVVALADAALTRANPPYPVWSASSEPLLLDALLGAAIGFGVFFLFYAGGFVYARASAEIRGEPFDDVAFGYGDVMLSTLCGLILGWRALIFAMFITVFLGALGATLFLIWQRIQLARTKIKREENVMTTALPYGPYIVIGAAVMLLFSDWIREVLLQAAYG